MMKYLSTLDTDIFVQVNTFNTKVDELVTCIKITPDNVEEINNKIKGIVCDGSTDIGLALTKANEDLLKYAEENPGHQLAHVFMTDGDPTAGVMSLPVLVGMVNESFNNKNISYFHFQQMLFPVVAQRYKTS